MLGQLAKKVFGSSNDRRLKGYRPKVAAINALEPELVGLSDAELAARTAMFREQLAAGKSLDDILVPAFATVREAAKRVLGQRHFDVQLIGGMVLHESGIAEMRPARARRSSRRSPSTSTRWPARASTSSPSTTTSPAATPNGWAASTASSA